MRSRDLLDPAESLVLQTCDEQAPATSADRAVKPPLLSDTRTRLLDGAARRTRHRPHVQLLDPNQVKPPRQVSGGLLEPRQPKSHPSDLGHPHPTEAAIQPLNVSRFEAHLSKSLVHTGFTPRRAAVRASKEVLHGLREVTQRLLLDRLTSGTKPRVLGAGLCQLRGLLQIAGSLPSPLPVLLLFHRQIPDIPRVSAVPQQCLFLLRGRQQSKPRYIRTVTTTTDTSGPSRPARAGIGFPAGLKSRVSNRRTF